MGKSPCCVFYCYYRQIANVDLSRVQASRSKQPPLKQTHFHYIVDGYFYFLHLTLFPLLFNYLI